MKTAILISFLMATLTVKSRAQTQPISLSQCINLAIENSYQIRGNQARQAATAAAFAVDRSQYFPQIFAEGAQDQLFYGQYNFRQQLGQVALDWRIGDWLFKTADVQKENLHALDAERQQISTDLAKRISFLYLEILQNQLNRDLLQNRLKMLTEHLQVARALWQAGTRTQFDLLQTRVSMNQLQEQIISQESGIHKRKQALAMLVGVSAQQFAELQDFPESILEKEFFPEQSDQGLAQNPRLKFLYFRQKAQRMQLQQVKASRLPHFQITSGYNVDRDPTAEGNYWRFSAGLQLPLFLWGRLKFQQQEIRASAEALQFRQKNVHRELQIRLQQIAENLKSLRAIYQLQKKRLQTTQNLLDLATTNYQAGLITNLEYLDAQKNLLENQLNQHQTRLSYVLNLIEYYALINQLDQVAQLQGAP